MKHKLYCETSILAFNEKLKAFLREATLKSYNIISTNFSTSIENTITEYCVLIIYK